jgi:hypothetical protein
MHAPGSGFNPSPAPVLLNGDPLARGEFFSNIALFSAFSEVV